ncbi:MAG: S1 RNA-binding domain-containing protein [Phycisphaerales bacterium]|nr:S1 RNA-binding domain-containing protein [Phycisphaerales bacterium]
MTPPAASTNGPAAPEAAAPAPAAPPASAIDAQTQAEIDEAMAALGFGGEPIEGGGGGRKKREVKPSATQMQHAHDIAPIGGVQKPALRGPRVVQAGREHRSGKVVSVGPTDIFLEFGPKELGVAQRINWPEDQLPVVGAEVEVVIERFEAAESLFICSKPGTVVKAAWESLEIGQTVEGKVVGTNKGGLEVEIAGHRAFLPASQVSLDRIPDLSVMIGEKLTCQVAQIDKRGKGNIVLGRRDLLAAERKQRAEKLKETLHEGDTVDGTVRKIMPFGAFVDVGGVDGLIHIGDLSYDRVGFGEQAIGKHLKEGQQVKVRVLKIEWNDEDLKKSRIGLGLKQLASDPFQTAVNDIKEGADVGGRITRLADFGAFVELAPGVEGLVHVSEIAHRRIGHPKDVLKENEVVRCKVLKLDAGARKISLSIKAMTEAPAAPAGKGGKDRAPMRSIEEITKETPALRRLRAQAALKAKSQQLKGGF